MFFVIKRSPFEAHFPGIHDVIGVKHFFDAAKNIEGRTVELFHQAPEFQPTPWCSLITPPSRIAARIAEFHILL